MAPNLTCLPFSLDGIDHLRAGDLVLQLNQSALDEALALLGGVVFGVLREVAVRARFGDGGDHRRPLFVLRRFISASRAV